METMFWRPLHLLLLVFCVKPFDVVYMSKCFCRHLLIRPVPVGNVGSMLNVCSLLLRHRRQCKAATTGNHVYQMSLSCQTRQDPGRIKSANRLNSGASMYRTTTLCAT